MHRILIADDQPMMRRYVRTVLESALDCEILEAADGADALALVRSESPDLVVLDVQMPKLTGPQVCQALKTDPATSGVRVVMLSAAVDPDVLGYGSLLGPDRFFAKPFRPHQLVDAIRELLGA
jgi:CheY-like chemotaxis protein